MPRDLAQELLDEIIHQVDDKESLKACALASSALLPSSHRRLFRTWLLDDRDAASEWAIDSESHLHPSRFQGPVVVFTAAKARKISIESPHLWNSARDITLHLFAKTPFALIQELFSKIPPLARLAIRDPLWNESITMHHLNLTSPSTKNVFILPTLRSVRLENVYGVPQSFISFALSTFEEVAFINIAIDRKVDRPARFSLPADQSPKAKELHVVAVTDWLNDTSRFTSILDIDLHEHLRGLEYLFGSFDTEHDSNWSQILEEADFTHSLQHLGLLFTPYFPPLNLRLPCFSVLRELELEFIIPSPFLPPELKDLMDMLPTSTPILESFTLFVRFYKDLTAPWPKDDDEVIPYETFVTMKHLPYLQKLDCGLSPARAFEGFGEYMSRLFPGPAQAGILYGCTYSKRT
ncbi:hypothetical protein R3P38DRAFT_3042908 [Favolaschia claudopus]|uniref:F-box domain-containing protein n=1 Tax=Favolaschia claudopus TaxID=2862362 RepID=A0AAW0A959_9AGAR